MSDSLKIDWEVAENWEKNNYILKYVTFDSDPDPMEWHFSDTSYCMALLCEKFPRGFRWRPDNKLLICYGGHDDPPTQIDCETFEDGAWVILLRLTGVEVKY